MNTSTYTREIKELEPFNKATMERVEYEKMLRALRELALRKPGDE